VFIAPLGFAYLERCGREISPRDQFSSKRYDFCPGFWTVVSDQQLPLFRKMTSWYAWVSAHWEMAFGNL
jgi:hypothetical protein